MNPLVVSVHRSTKPKLIDNPREAVEAQQFLWNHIIKPGNNAVLTSGVMTPEIQTIIEKTKLLICDPISRKCVDEIQLIRGGVVGDNYLFVPNTLPNGLVKRRFNEVNIFTLEELTRLNLIFGTNVLPGGVGENITTSGIDVDSLPVGTLLGIGDSVVRIAGRRSFCWKFMATFTKQDFYKPSDVKKFKLTSIGIATQTVTPGTVKPGDSIQVLKLGNGPSYQQTTKKKLILFELFNSESEIDPILPFIETDNQTNT